MHNSPEECSFHPNLRAVPRIIHSVQEVELAVNLKQQAILSSYHQNFAVRMALLPRRVTWWNKELSHLTTTTRWQRNQAKRTGNSESYKTAVTCYNKQIIKATRSSLRDYCRGIKDVPHRVRLMKVMASQLVNIVWSIKLPDGCYTQLEKETLKKIHKFHFPESAGVVVSLEGEDLPNLRASAPHR